MTTTLAHKNRYLNPWYKGLNRSNVSPWYDNNARCLHEYRGVRIFSVNGGYDFVFAGVCITQRAGITKYMEAIDELFSGNHPVDEAVKEHLNANGVEECKSYDEFD